MTWSFLGSLAATVAALACVTATGLLRRRKLHVACVAIALVSLGLTIKYAYELGTRHDLEAAGWITPVHLALAKLATFSLAFPVLSGLRTWFHPSARRMHRGFAFVALALTLAAAVTGVAMILRAPAY